MDRIKTDIDGGLPFDLPDLEFLQDSIQLPLKALAKSIAQGKDCILTGCEFNSGEITEGYIFLDGELLKCTGMKNPQIHPNSTIHWIKETTETNSVMPELGTKEIDSWVLERAVPSLTYLTGSVILKRIKILHKADQYEHPPKHPISMITETDDEKVMTNTERIALKNLGNAHTNANSHSPSLISQDSNNRFVSDAEKSDWNNIKNAHSTDDSHSPSLIDQDENNRFFTDAERAKLAGIADNATNFSYTHPQHTLDDIDNSKTHVKMTVEEQAKLTSLNIPSGLIVMWNGTTPPDGWVLCDGQNNTPDLRGRFILGTDFSTYSIGTTGGASHVQLNENDLPKHSHQYSVAFCDEVKEARGGGGFGHRYDYINGDKYGIRDVTWYNRDGAHSGKKTGTTFEEGGGDPNFYIHAALESPRTTFIGGGRSHENRPPYYTLAYIMKL